MPITSVQIVELETLIMDSKINDKLTKQVITGVLAGEGDPAEVIKVYGLEVVSGVGALEPAMKQALTDNSDVVEGIKGGRMAVIGILMGSVVKATRDSIDAKTIEELTMKGLGLWGFALI